MLGFSTYSETPFSVASVALIATAFTGAAIVAGVVTAVGYDAKAVTNAPQAPAVTLSVSALSDVDAQATTDLTAVPADLYISAFSEVYGTANTTSTAVTASFATSALDYVAQATTFITANELLELRFGPLSDVDAQATIVPPETTSVGYAGVLTYIAPAKSYIDSVSGQMYNALSEPIGVKFDYAAIADSYNPHRVIYLVAQDNRDSVYVSTESRVVTLVEPDRNNTIHLPHIDFTVYLAPQDKNNTVYITT